MEKKTRVIMIDDPQGPLSLGAQRLAKEAVERFWDSGAAGGDVQVAMISIASPHEPWYGNPDGTVKEPDYDKIMVWAAGYRRKVWQKYYQTALARMDEWQDA